jgi:hypothetical protein
MSVPDTAQISINRTPLMRDAITHVMLDSTRLQPHFGKQRKDDSAIAFNDAVSQTDFSY